MSTAGAASEPEVLMEKRGTALSVVLNRPKALNALTLQMVRDLMQALRTASSDDAVKCMVLRGAGGKAFCAGGDVKGVWQAAKQPASAASSASASSLSLPDSFFREEYELNAAIARMPKPQLSLWDGIVMGGGAGVSVHGRFRVATERSLFAMPETSIGFFPDVGASSFLSSLPGELGTYIALSGDRLEAADLMYTGLATHFVPSTNLAELEREICQVQTAEDIEELLSRLGSAAPTPPLQEVRATVDRCFAHDTVEAIESSLAADGGVWAAKALQTLSQRSPTSKKVALRLLRGAKNKTLGQCLRAEFRASQRFVTPPSDFFEGIRAALVDKDKKPIWAPQQTAEVTDAIVEEYFAALSKPELDV